MDNLTITESVKRNLLSAVKWLKFLTILATIGMVFMIIAGIALMFLPASSGMPGYVASIIYFIAFGLYIYPVKKCYDIIGSARDAMLYDAQDSLEAFAESTKDVMKYCGIIAIVCLCLYAMIFVVALVGGIAAAVAFR